MHAQASICLGEIEGTGRLMEEVGAWREKEEILRGREKALGKVGGALNV